jgi:hypothetical protein
MTAQKNAKEKTPPLTAVPDVAAAQPEPQLSALATRVVKPPKYAIANGYFTGVLPENLQKATRAELALCSPAKKTGYITVVQGGGQRRLKGHTSSHHLDVSAVASCLPLRPQDAPYRVLLVGHFTPEQKRKLMQDHLINAQMVRKLLMYWRTENHIFKKMDLNDERLNGLPIPDSEGNVPYLPAIISVEEKEQQGTAPTATGGPHVQSTADSGSACSYPTTIRLIGSSPAQSSHLQGARHLQGISHGKFTVCASSTYVQRYDRDWFTVAMPALFPYGRGGLDERRLNKVSPQKSLQHLMRLSHGRFLSW